MFVQIKARMPGPPSFVGTTFDFYGFNLQNECSLLVSVTRSLHLFSGPWANRNFGSFTHSCYDLSPSPWKVTEKLKPRRAGTSKLNVN